MKTILVALDFSDSTDPILDAACRISQLEGASLVLVHAVEPIPEFVGYDAGAVVAAGSEPTPDMFLPRLNEIKTELQNRGIPATAAQETGVPADVILAKAEEVGAGMIIMGSHGHGALFHLLVGSVTETVLKKTGVPVLIVPLRSKDDGERGD